LEAEATAFSRISQAIWLSDRAKEDIDRLGAAQHKHLKWKRHDGVAMKGFPGVFILWSLGDMHGQV